MGSLNKNRIITLYVFCALPFLMFGQNEPLTSPESKASTSTTQISIAEQDKEADLAAQTLKIL